MSKEIIVCKNMDKTFETSRGAVHVIEDVTLNVHENELLVLFGPGQCGKSTMINCMSGLEPVTEGSVEVNGKKVIKPGPDRGVVYQRMALFPWLTVMGNVEYGPKMRGVPKKERRERAQHYIELVGLKGFENSYPNQLSGGMQQRVGIARAYCNEPDVLFMDEPFGHLDAQTRYLMQEDLMKIWEKEKRTIVFVTNNIEEAIYLADRIIVMTNCPTKIKKEYKIDLPRPRNYVDEEFLKLREEISTVVDKALQEGENMEKQDIILHVDHMTKCFGDLKVLNDISFDVHRGEFLCIVGPTGCGKTTFLNCITGLYDLTGGQILVNGELVDTKKHNIAYIFQEYSTMSWLTVEENVAFGLKMKRMPKDVIKKEVAEVLEMVGLTKYKDYYPVELSTSMLQRVVIARAFAVKPDILLMDEPYGQLDVELRFRLEDELIKLWQKLGTTVIFITHNIEEAVYLSENILVLTNKPTSIKHKLENTLPRPRNVVEPAFIDLRNQVTELIKWW